MKMNLGRMAAAGAAAALLLVGGVPSAGAQLFPDEPLGRRVIPGVATVAEGASGSQVVEVPVRLSEPFTETVTAEWVTVFGPGIEPPAAAEPGVDFAEAGGTVTFAPGETEATVEITVFGDEVEEPDEWVVVSFRNPTNAGLGGYLGLGFVVIEDDDTPLPRIIPGGATITEGASGSQVVEVPIELSRPSTRTVTANWATIFGPGVEPPVAAEPGVDFLEASGTITFAPGETSTTISLTVLGDDLDEPDEWIVVSFHQPTNATMSGYWGLGFALIQIGDAPA